MGKIKLDKNDVRTIKNLIDNSQLTDTEIAKIYGVTRKHINSIRNNKRWNYDWL
jgi:hypothetical protein